MSILVTGGAGYIGSHAVAALVEKGQDVVIIDNLVNGHKQSLIGGRLYIGDLRDKDFLRNLFKKEKIEKVIHFAAFSLVGESMTSPYKYFENNCYGTLNLLQAMAEHSVKYMVFSSTAAVYGEPAKVPIEENDQKNPTNVYGESKKIAGSFMDWYDKVYGIKYAELRYFNVAGAHKSGDIGEDHKEETHLIPIVLSAALGKRESVDIFGNDYDTPDGTCIRDYIHVNDLISAHLLSLDYLERTNTSQAFNLGNGDGFSVNEVIESAKRVTGKDIKVSVKDRRPGDPSVLIASSEKAKKILGWSPEYNNLDDIIDSAWKWHSRHPEGYRD